MLQEAMSSQSGSASGFRNLSEMRKRCGGHGPPSWLPDPPLSLGAFPLGPRLGHQMGLSAHGIFTALATRLVPELQDFN